jgi:hypothetical protein
VQIDVSKIRFFIAGACLQAVWQKQPATAALLVEVGAASALLVERTTLCSCC